MGSGWVWWGILFIPALGRQISREFGVTGLCRKSPFKKRKKIGRLVKEQRAGPADLAGFGRHDWAVRNQKELTSWKPPELFLRVLSAS